MEVRDQKLDANVEPMNPKIVEFQTKSIKTQQKQNEQIQYLTDQIKRFEGQLINTPTRRERRADTLAVFGLLLAIIGVGLAGFGMFTAINNERLDLLLENKITEKFEEKISEQEALILDQKQELDDFLDSIKGPGLK